MKIIYAITAIAVGIFFFAAASTWAGPLDWIKDARDAVAGHIDDINERINHEDEHIDGMVIATSEFRRDDVGRDGIHWANGSVSLVSDGSGLHVQLGGDFESGPAPDLYIYVADQKVVDEGTFWDSETVEISELDSGSGAQHYRLPESLTSQSHLEVVIWCKRFGAFIGAATLENK